MKPKLFFGLSLEFDITLNEQLRELSVLSFYDKGLHRYIYVFGLDRLKEVSSLINQPMLFESEDITKLMYYTKQLSEDIELHGWKGKSGYEVAEFPKIYRIISYQKSKGSKPVRQMHVVNKETLLRIWKVYQRFKKDKFYDFEYITENICKEFNLARFFRPNSKSFDKQKYQGTRPSQEYGIYYYYPGIVMEWLGLIERKGRFHKRIKDRFEEQAKIS